MRTQKTKVTLISHTANPLEAIYTEWQLSRTEGPVPSIDELKDRIYDEKQLNEFDDQLKESALEKEIQTVAEKVINMRMPLGEHIHLLFVLEHVPIALREQIVRHRIGHKFGDRLGADTVPNLAGDSSFWSQTTRIINMGEFADKGEYRVCQWLEENSRRPFGDSRRINVSTGEQENVSILDEWHAFMEKIQSKYKQFVAHGMPLEDARDILPLGMQHRMTWSTNLSAIMHVLHRRGCWLAQLGMWEPVITGIVEELATKIHPMFRRLIDPPCFDSSGAFVGCAFGKENEEVISKGAYPPCSLWVNKQALPSIGFRPSNDGIETVPDETHFVSKVQMPRYLKMQQKYEKLWRRDPKTGERKEVSSVGTT